MRPRGGAPTRCLARGARALGAIRSVPRFSRTIRVAEVRCREKCGLETQDASWVGERVPPPPDLTTSWQPDRFNLRRSLAMPDADGGIKRRSIFKMVASSAALGAVLRNGARIISHWKG